MNKNLKLTFFVLFGVLGFYIFEFYFQDNNPNLHFWCIQTLNNFNLGPIKDLTLPIHCDEGPYRLASQSINEFFSPNNPYQTRPLFLLLIYLSRNLVDEVTLLNLSEYQVFRISTFMVQLIILLITVFIFAKLMNLNFKSYSDYIVILIFIGIPGVRWNMLFPSAGNLTFLLFLLSLFIINNKKSNIKKYHYLILSFLSLAHLSSLIYGAIIQLWTIFNLKRIRITEIALNFTVLLFFPAFYALFVYFSKYEFYDWHTSTYNQFSWIYIEFQNGYIPLINATRNFLTSYLEVTFDYIGYFLILCIYSIFLLVITKLNDYVIPQKIKNALFINLLIFIFWGFQGIYESFRFTNYSIGYLLFVSIIIFSIETYKNNLYLQFSILTYVLSLNYLEAYNSALNFPQFNVLTVLSLIIFMVFLYKEIPLNRDEFVNGL